MNKNAIGLHKFSRIFRRGILQYFPHIPCRLQHALPITRKTCYSLCLHTLRADCNPPNRNKTSKPLLCLHTLRADCNNPANFHRCFPCALPPHAPCRLQPNRTERNIIQTCFASTRSVQIATAASSSFSAASSLCLHTLRADCNQPPLRRFCYPRSLPPHAPCRLQRQKCTELQYTFFRTRVESVDSFSVLNKSMLR